MGGNVFQVKLVLDRLRGLFQKGLNALYQHNIVFTKGVSFRAAHEDNYEGAASATTVEQLTATKADGGEIKHTVILFVACLHNPALCHQAAQVFHFHSIQEVTHLTVTSTVEDKTPSFHAPLIMTAEAQADKWNAAAVKYSVAPGVRSISITLTCKPF